MDDKQHVGEGTHAVLGKPEMVGNTKKVTIVPAPKGAKPLSGKELAKRPGLRGPNDKCRIRGQVVAVLTHANGEKETFVTHNIVTNDGDEYYAETAAQETPNFTVAGMRLGSNAGVATAPLKTDVKLQTTTGSSLIASSAKAIDGTYPRTSDPDADNPGAGADIVTWRTSYTTGEANSNDIASLDLPDSLTDVSITKSLAVANFATKFNKTSSDTLKVFVNHTFNGV
jgi:hypothetical protein